MASWRGPNGRSPRWHAPLVFCPRATSFWTRSHAAELAGRLAGQASHGSGTSGSTGLPPESTWPSSLLPWLLAGWAGRCLRRPPPLLPAASSWGLGPGALLRLMSVPHLGSALSCQRPGSVSCSLTLSSFCLSGSVYASGTDLQLLVLAPHPVPRFSCPWLGWPLVQLTSAGRLVSVGHPQRSRQLLGLVSSSPPSHTPHAYMRQHSWGVLIPGDVAEQCGAVVLP